jgi:NitT/TauT family transport system ATP-binding protein
MAIDPIPQVGISRVIGLLQVLDDAGGRHDVFRLTREVNFEFGEMLKVVKAAEMLDLVVTPGGDVVLTAIGKELLRGKVNARKKVMKAQIQKLALFRTVLETLEKAEEQRADEATFLELFANQLPAEDAEALLKTVVDWGRYAELLGYNPDDRVIYLDHGEAPPA